MGENGALPAGTETVLLQFVDLHGVPRGTYVPADRWVDASEAGAGFAALIAAVFENHEERGIVHGMSVGPESPGVTALPDPGSVAPTPWTGEGDAVAQCSLAQDGEPFALCSRSALSRAVEGVADLGYEARVGAELEFTALDGAALDPVGEDIAGASGTADDGDGDRTEDLDADAIAAATTTGARPYDARTLQAASGYIAALFEALEAAGTGAEAVQRESAPGQLEASLGHAPPLRAADGVVIARQAARGVAREHGYGVTFMPFPTADYEGNGLHVHVSLQADGEDALADPDDQRGLSATAYGFIGGVLSHADALTAVCAPTVNSYKRFQPGTFAPVDRSYGVDNRTALVRIPPTDGATRLEVRLPDGYANPYLALAGILAAGAEGIRSDRRPPEPGSRDRYAEGDEGLPASLGAALDALADDEVVTGALGDPLVEGFCTLKRDELARFHGAVTDWEAREYVDRL